MARFNSDFWEIPTEAGFLENTAAEKAMWFETEYDRERRYALQDFYASVLPFVRELIDSRLTPRQRDVLRLYFFQNMTQEDIAATLRLSQSTVSRHLFGATRNGKKVGGAIPKLKKMVERLDTGFVADALNTLRARFETAA